jgi:hypothetical protein
MLDDSDVLPVPQAIVTSRPHCCLYITLWAFTYLTAASDNEDSNPLTRIVNQFQAIFSRLNAERQMGSSKAKPRASNHAMADLERVSTPPPTRQSAPS